MSIWKNGKTRAIAAATAVVMVVAVAAVGGAAQQEPQGRHGGRQPFMGSWFAPGPRAMAIGLALRGLRELNLTDAQRNSIRGAMQSHRDEFKAIARDAIAARSALGDAVTADTIDQNAIRALSAKVAEVELSAALLRARVHAEVFALLTPEQQQKAKELRENAKGRIKGAIARRLEP